MMIALDKMARKRSFMEDVMEDCAFLGDIECYEDMESSNSASNGFSVNICSSFASTEGQHTSRKCSVSTFSSVQIGQLYPANKVHRLSPPSPVNKSLKARFDSILRSESENTNAIKKNDFFSCLPDELMLQVFSYLPKSDICSCAKVSRRFHKIAHDESLWRSLDYTRKQVREAALYSTISRAKPRLLRLSNASVKSSTSCVYPIIEQKNLRYLDLTNCTLSTRFITSLLRGCTQLRKLSLENCSVTDEICEAIAQNSQLDTLNLCMVSGLTPRGVLLILKHCQNLQSLNIAWTTMKAAGMHNLVSSLSPKMRELNISGYVDSLQNYHVEQICHSCPNLIHLDISDNKKLTSASINYIVEHLHNLEQLHISRCFAIRLESFSDLKKIKTLRQLTNYGLPGDVEVIRELLPGISLNELPLSTIARPQVGPEQNESIWGVQYFAYM